VVFHFYDVKGGRKGKNPLASHLGPMLVGEPRLPCLHFYHQRCFEIGGELLGSSLARKEIFWDWNLLYAFTHNTLNSPTQGVEFRVLGYRV